MAEKTERLPWKRDGKRDFGFFVMNFPGGLRCGIFSKDKKGKIYMQAKGEYLLIEDFFKGFDTNGINKAICF